MKIPLMNSGNPKTEMKNGGAITSCAHTLLLAQPNEKHMTQSFEVPFVDGIKKKNEGPHESRDDTTNRKVHGCFFF